MLTSSTATTPPAKIFVRARSSRPEPCGGASEGAAPAAPSCCCVPCGSSPAIPARLGGEELVPALDLVLVLLEVRVPGAVVARAVGERAAVAHLALLDVAHLASDPGQVLRG